MNIFHNPKMRYHNKNDFHLLHLQQSTHHTSKVMFAFLVLATPPSRHSRLLCICRDIMTTQEFRWPSCFPSIGNQILVKRSTASGIFNGDGTVISLRD